MSAQVRNLPTPIQEEEDSYTLHLGAEEHSDATNQSSSTAATTTTHLTVSAAAPTPSTAAAPVDYRRPSHTSLVAALSQLEHNPAPPLKTWSPTAASTSTHTFPVTSSQPHAAATSTVAAVPVSSPHASNAPRATNTAGSKSIATVVLDLTSMGSNAALASAGTNQASANKSIPVVEYSLPMSPVRPLASSHPSSNPSFTTPSSFAYIPSTHSPMPNNSISSSVTSTPTLLGTTSITAMTVPTAAEQETYRRFVASAALLEKEAHAPRDRKKPSSHHKLPRSESSSSSNRKKRLKAYLAAKDEEALGKDGMAAEEIALAIAAEKRRAARRKALREGLLLAAEVDKDKKEGESKDDATNTAVATSTESGANSLLDPEAGNELPDSLFPSFTRSERKLLYRWFSFTNRKQNELLESVQAAHKESEQQYTALREATRETFSEMASEIFQLRQSTALLQQINIEQKQKEQQLLLQTSSTSPLQLNFNQSASATSSTTPSASFSQTGSTTTPPLPQLLSVSAAATPIHATQPESTSHVAPTGTASAPASQRSSPTSAATTALVTTTASANNELAALPTALSSAPTSFQPAESQPMTTRDLSHNTPPLAPVNAAPSSSSADPNANSLSSLQQLATLTMGTTPQVRSPQAPMNGMSYAANIGMMQPQQQMPPQSMMMNSQDYLNAQLFNQQRQQQQQQQQQQLTATQQFQLQQQMLYLQLQSMRSRPASARRDPPLASRLSSSRLRPATSQGAASSRSASAGSRRPATKGPPILGRPIFGTVGSTGGRPASASSSKPLPYSTAELVQAQVLAQQRAAMMAAAAQQTPPLPYGYTVRSPTKLIGVNSTVAAAGPHMNGIRPMTAMPVAMSSPGSVGRPLSAGAVALNRATSPHRSPTRVPTTSPLGINPYALVQQYGLMPPNVGLVNPAIAVPHQHPSSAYKQILSNKVIHKYAETAAPPTPRQHFQKLYNGQRK